MRLAIRKLIMEVTPREVHELKKGRREMNYDWGDGKTFPENVAFQLGRSNFDSNGCQQKSVIDGENVQRLGGRKIQTPLGK